jgi:hypothetical protein
VDLIFKGMIKMFNDIEEAMEYLDGENALKLDGFDDCIIGIVERRGQKPLLVYSREKIINSLMSGMTREDAEEYIDYNISGAWMGEGTPLVMLEVGIEN